jgi:hypothetical protein
VCIYRATADTKLKSGITIFTGFSQVNSNSLQGFEDGDKGISETSPLQSISGITNPQVGRFFFINNPKIIIFLRPDATMPDARSS